MAQVDIPFRKVVLDNGLTVIVHEDHKTPIVNVTVWYHVGSKNEKPGRTGFAHLFEHLMFNGSEHYNNDYFKAVEPVGVDMTIPSQPNEDSGRRSTSTTTSSMRSRSAFSTVASLSAQLS